MKKEMDLCQVVYNNLATQIRFGAYRFGDQLPTLEELSHLQMVCRQIGGTCRLSVEPVCGAYGRTGIFRSRISAYSFQFEGLNGCTTLLPSPQKEGTVEMTAPSFYVSTFFRIFAGTSIFRISACAIHETDGSHPEALQENRPFRTPLPHQHLPERYLQS